MKRKVLLVIILFSLFGCGGVSFYSTNTYTIYAKQTKTGTPAENSPIRLIYPYDHYGVFYIWNAPSAFESFLNKQGQLEIKISKFYHPQLVVGSTIFFLNESFFEKGEQPFKEYQENDDRYKRDRDAYNMLKLPATKYPEVDIVIKKLNQ
jgi:hypothetical protein